jgi:hypothetical protein
MLEDHVHGEDGHIQPEVAAAEAEVEAVEVEAVADVQIAQIQSDTAIALAKIDARQEPTELELELVALRAEVEALRNPVPPASFQAAEPEEQAPPIVVVDSGDNAPDDAGTDLPPSVPEEHHRSQKNTNPWW